MCQLFETIKVENRKIFNISYHQERLNRSRAEIFGLKNELNLMDLIKIPDLVDDSIYRCRINYDRQINKIEFFPYKFKEIRRIKIIENNDLSYAYKFENRSVFQQLLNENPDFDEVIICKNGNLTDSTIANLALFDGTNWFTPSTYLLKGTKRTYLLDNQLITEEKIGVNDLQKFKKIAFINAMRDLDSAVSIDDLRL